MSGSQSDGLFPDTDSDSPSDSEDYLTKATGEAAGRNSTGPAHDNPLTSLQQKLGGLSEAYDLVVKNSSQLLKFAGEWEGGEVADGETAKPKEKFALFKITAEAMLKVREKVLI